MCLHGAISKHFEIIIMDVKIFKCIFICEIKKWLNISWMEVFLAVLLLKVSLLSEKLLFVTEKNKSPPVVHFDVQIWTWKYCKNGEYVVGDRSQH